jgi:predicted hydrocarbon binding protein
MPKSNILLPSNAGYAFFTSLESIIGKVGVTAVLRYAGQNQYIDNYPPNTDDPSMDLADFAAIHAGIETLYGWRGGKALIMNAGRETWKRFVSSSLSACPVDEVLESICSAPEEDRILHTVNFVANVFIPSEEHDVELINMDDKVLFKTKVCPSCWGRKMQKPGCHLTAGYIQEAVRWTTGNLHAIEQTTCIGCGDDFCSFQISKNNAE